MTELTPAPFRLFYVDDSGAEETGYVVYSWIETTPDGWHSGLASWLELRRELYANYKIPPAFELHATKFVSGRQRPSTEPGVNHSRRVRRAIVENALATIRSTSDLRVGTVYRRTAARRAEYQREKNAVYSGFITHLDARLARHDELGMVIMDGDGTENSYYGAHRGLRLGTRRIIEDPMFQASHRSQWVQMADLVAWSAYQSLLGHPGKEFAWDWYDKHLGGSDVNGGPLSI